ncbi:MAG TPA: glycerophosphodiester phosphodiesterase [Opitutaceae bacterium]|nr:glycerophosphodiester phosphodiesterase [Opitutaceae bacterium]
MKAMRLDRRAGKFAVLALALAAGSALGAGARPCVIAHRGASGYLPEHTLPAKAYAYAVGADYLEQDVVLTKDDVPVVLHDVYVDTVTDVARQFPDRRRPDGHFYALDLTLAEIKQLHVTERFNAATGRPVYSHRFPAGQSVFRVSTLEEELQFIQGLNRSTGRRTGIYPEIKRPQWHRRQGHDISRITIPILVRYGYATKADPCYLQCFDLAELRRIRSELNWQGRMILLVQTKARGDEGTNYDHVCTAEGMREISDVVDGIGPAIPRVVTWTSAGTEQVTPLVALAHRAGLVVHPYTIRRDDLPRNCPSLEALHVALFRDAHIDGVFSDFPDLTLAWLHRNESP